MDSADVMDRIVYSPHIYGPDVYDHAYFKSPKLKETLKEVRPYFQEWCRFPE